MGKSIRLRVLFFILGFLVHLNVFQAQELEARVQVIADQMPVELNRRIFQQLEQDISNFLNNYHWSNDNYEYYERIICSFILNLEAYRGNNIYSGTLNVQGLRPVYNSTYLVPLLNIIDREISFQYLENQNITFNESSNQGTGSPLQANLVSILAFYAYMILGLDYSSFALKDGYKYFQKAFSIVNSAPENSMISGWTPYQSRRNRYWIADIFVNPIYNNIYDSYYKFYREGIDNLYKRDKTIPKKILESLDVLVETASQNQRNLSIYPIFIQGKYDILLEIFKNASKQEKTELLVFIEKIDPSNALSYSRALQ